MHCRRWKNGETRLDRQQRIDRLQAELAKELGPSERIVWKGYPDDRVVFRKLRWLVLVALPILAVSAPFALDYLIAQFLILVAMALFLGPFVSAARARSTIYALTDQRALVLSRSFGYRSISSVDLSAADDKAEILPSEGNAGTVLFVSGLSPRRRYTDYTGKFGFWDVPDASSVAATVEEVIRNVRR